MHIDSVTVSFSDDKIFDHRGKSARDNSATSNDFMPVYLLNPQMQA
ncbi:hypothetical protein HMPREF0299_5423 [Corynebacterium matruchotii ATCC 14266]|uniref:Uncharacterized protein n=1 Tax=Corynebacterium matruchotii ATCC 14266 TaxID=553207 RepID=E0DIB2_9CORY|nr:hypothetical protein HMPREF0299_5423 [Corynebacterium matruchotii ATCC 14266]